MAPPRESLPEALASSDWKKPPLTRSSRLDGEDSSGAGRSGLSSESSSGLVLTVTLRVVRGAESDDDADAAERSA